MLDSQMPVLATLLASSLLSPLACSLSSEPTAQDTKISGHAEETITLQLEAKGSRVGSSDSLGRLTKGDVVPLAKILNRTLQEAEKVLGEPTDRGSGRISCVRFVPDRVFFKCEQETRVYDGSKLNLKFVDVEYEDGRAASVSLIGLPGDGPFDLERALSLVGLDLPGEPHHKQPTEFLPGDASDVRVWDFGNSAARLLVDGLQHRVQVSVVDSDWARAKIKVIVNHPLNADQTARIRPVSRVGSEAKN